MPKSSPFHYRITSAPRVSGFSVVSVAAGNYYWSLTRAFVHSDQKEFYKYVGQLYGLFVGDRFLVNQVHTFLVLIHKDSSADVYVNDFPISLLAMAKGDFRQGQLVTSREFADISELRFDGIPITTDDSIIFCFRQRWKFGLFFDLTPTDGSSEINVDQLYKDLGSYYKHLAFQETYAVVQNESMYRQLFDDGWFPFIQLLGDDYEKLSEIYQETTNRDALLANFLNAYDKDRIHSFTQYWWRKKSFEDKKDLLTVGIDAYLTVTPAGYISCIKTLYSEIEGILRLAFFHEYGKDPTFSDLKKFVEDKANSKFVSPGSLGFPDLLYGYFNDVIFGNFDLKDQDVELSRHSVSHGVAQPSQYTKARALQAILTLDQMHFFMS